MLKKHGLEPAPRGRFRRRSSSYGGQDEGQAARATRPSAAALCAMARLAPVTELGPDMRFCETNPPFLGGVFNASAYVYMCCNAKSGIYSVGSFWKTNPPESGLGGAIDRKVCSFQDNEAIERSRDGNVPPT